MSSDKSSDDADGERCEETVPVGERHALACGSSASGGNAPASGNSSDHPEDCGCCVCSSVVHMGMEGTLRVSVSFTEFTFPGSASGGDAPACGLASGSNAPARENPCGTSEHRRHQKRRPFCGSRAMGGVDFDGSPISETDDEEHTDEHIPGNLIGYHEIWDHEDTPLGHDIVDRSELPQGYRFAASLSREELRARYQFRGHEIGVDSTDAADDYVRSS